MPATAQRSCAGDTAMRPAAPARGTPHGLILESARAATGSSCLRAHLPPPAPRCYRQSVSLQAATAAHRELLPAGRGGLTSNRTHSILLPSDCPTDRDLLKCLRRNAVAGRSWQRSQPPRSLAIVRSFEFFTAAGRTSFTWRVYLSTIESDRVGLFVTRGRIEALRRGAQLAPR